MPFAYIPFHAFQGKAKAKVAKVLPHVLGKRRPELIRPYVEELQNISETDVNRVVRIHCQGAIKATESI